jgi:hypothetical protein
MPDVNVDPAAVDAARNVMTQNKDSIVADLQGLLTAVQILLTDSGGLWMKQASPAMNTEFTKFANNLRELISSINNFTSLFNTTVTNLAQLDTGYSKQTK